MRPVGTYGGIAQALADAAGHGPGTVRQLAERSQVGYSVAAYTATRMVQRGQLEVVSDARPAVLSLPGGSEGERVPADVGMSALCGAWFSKEPNEALQQAWDDL